ncbi:hypothetical protein [Catenuloplanes japonicus]|uniref:hypothetical protein n=1 Tax=Catenuloplanes japonicus TaxID=33876 RepID=UPI000525FA2E|nr:hypothetical protein [Catenuloplanes japonicus]
MANHDGYLVEPAAMDRLGADITALGAPLEAQSGPWSQAAAGIATGDPALDAETRQVAAWIARVLHALARESRTLGGNVGRAMATYREADEQVAATFRSIGADRPPSV